MTEALVDRIYEAAFVPELWSDVLETICSRAGVSNAAMTIHRKGSRSLACHTPQLEDLVTQLLDYLDRSTMAAYLVRNPPAAFVHDLEYVPPQVLETDLISQACKAHGRRGVVMTNFVMPTRDDVFVTLERGPRDERPGDPVLAWLNELRPHLARAAMISARLNLARAESAVKTLSSLGLPAAVLASGSAVTAMNDRFEALLSGPFKVGAFDRLTMARANAQVLFKQAVDQSDPAAPTTKSIPLPAVGDDPSMIVHVTPIARSAHDIFNQAACIVVATPIGVVDVPDGAMLNGLFDLTPAEARLARHLAEGRTVQQIAKNLGLSVFTLRAQLRSIFAKTGTCRQADLIRLMGSVRATAMPS